TPSVWNVITGDFNGDGRTDYARLHGTATTVWLSNGDGTFTSVSQFYPGGADYGTPSVWNVITGGFNGDGRTDYARLHGTATTVWLSNGDGTLTSLSQFSPRRSSDGTPSVWNVITGDFNGDGRTDYARLHGTATTVWLSNGDGTFTSVSQFYPGGAD